MIYLIIILLAYALFLYCAIKNKKCLFLTILILLRCYYDYLYIYLGYCLPSEIVFILKPFQEMIILLGCVIILINKKNYLKFKIDKLQEKLLLLIIIPLFISLIISMLLGIDIPTVINGLRSFFVPILCCYIIFYRGPITINEKIFNIIIITTVLLGLYQTITFKGSVNELWPYNSYSDAHGVNVMDKSYYNYIKNDKLRAISFFVTPTEFSMISAVCGLYFFNKYLNYSRLINILYFGIAIFGIAISQTRIGFFALIIGIVDIIYIHKHNRLSKIFLIGFPIGMIMITIGYLMFSSSTDLSAAGRLVQYIEFWQTFNPIGKGMNDMKVVFDYDSFYLSSLNIFGLFGLLYLMFYVYITKDIIDSYNVSVNRDQFDKYTITIASIMIYVFGFHHIAGSFIYWFTLLLIFDMIAKQKFMVIKQSDIIIY